MKPYWPNVDGYLQSNLELLQDKVLNHDWDCIVAVDGEEGSGKSVMAQQIGYMLSTDGIELDNIVFTPRQFKRTIINSPKHNVIIWDEARGGLNSRRSMSSVNNTIVDMLAEIRQKNLFVIIVMPSFFDMDRNPAIWRTKFLIHVYTDDDWNRGFFRAYNKEKKKLLYFRGKKEYDYSKKIIQPNFSGKFGNYYTVDEKAYREKKLENLRAANLNTEGIKEFLEYTELRALNEFKEAGIIKKGGLQTYAKWKGITPSGLSKRIARLKPIKQYIRNDVLEDLKLDD